MLPVHNNKEYIQYNPSTPNKASQNNDSNEYYFGANPKLSTSFIIEAICNKELSSLERVIDFIHKNSKLMCLDIGMEEYIEPLYIKIVLQAASRFGITFLFESIYEKQKYLQIMSKKGFIENVDYYSLFSENQLSIAFLGYPTKAFLDANEKSNYRVHADGNILYISNSDANKVSIKNLYIDSEWIKKNIDLIDRDVHYSGVFPRLKKINKLPSNFSVKDTDILELEIERTTFFTVDALSYFYIDKHVYMENYRDILQKLYQSEDQLLSDTLFNHNIDESDYLCTVNKYLEKSQFTNLIGVSGNIETSDGYYLLTERASKAIDKFTIYPSVNGQSEIYDKNVDFYNFSVSEDKPSIYIDKNDRIDFNEELSRESIAELSILNFEDKWNYYGIAAVGINNYGLNNPMERRLHFNILASNRASKDLYQISKKIGHSTEKFESQRFFAINVRLFESKKNYILTVINDVLSFFSRWKSIFTAIIGLGFMFISILSFSPSSNVVSMVKTILDSLVSIALLSYSFVEAKKAYAVWKKLRYIKKKIDVINVDFTTEKKEDIINHFESMGSIVLNYYSKNDYKLSYHRMSYLMFFIYFLEQYKKQKL